MICFNFAGKLFPGQAMTGPQLLDPGLELFNQPKLSFLVKQPNNT